MEGYVWLHRKSLESSVWKNPIIWTVWSWCLMKALHKDTSFPFNGKDIVIQKGQFITGRDKAVGELPKITPQQYRTAITYLKSTNRITTKSTNKFTIISIINWSIYQPFNNKINQQNNHQINQPVTSQQPANNQQITTYNNDNNEKNDKNKSFAANAARGEESKPSEIIPSEEKETNELSSDGSSEEKLGAIEMVSTQGVVVPEVIPDLSQDKQLHIRRIGLFARFTGVRFTSKLHQQKFIKRNLRPAKDLEPYTDEEIVRVMVYLQQTADFKWTLESVGKYIDSDLERLDRLKQKEGNMISV